MEMRKGRKKRGNKAVRSFLTANQVRTCYFLFSKTHLIVFLNISVNKRTQTALG